MGALGPPPAKGPRGRGRRLVRPLRALAGAAFLLAVAGAVLPGRAGEASAVGLVAVLVASPLARVAFLAVRWFQIGDRRFGATAVALLAVVATGATVAVLAS